MLPEQKLDQTGATRRNLLRAGGALTLLSASGQVIAANGRTVRIGWVSPRTGPLAPFGEVDQFVEQGVLAAIKNGVQIGGKNHAVEIVAKDSQSNPNRAAEVAADLILKDNIDIMVTGGTPETTNPVADQCELNGVPCISSTCPWQAWFFGRGGNPKQGFEWTYHFFWGLEDIIATFTNIWKTVPNNKVVGLLLPNDGDGAAWGDPKLGLPPALKAMGFTVVDPGRYQAFQADFSAQISAFKKAGVEVVAGVPTPPDFKNFWTQARQQGFKPKCVTMGKAIAFPAAVDALGDAADGLSQELWWTPVNPYKSSLNGQSSKAMAAAYEQQSKRQWNGALGYSHANFEVAIDTLKRTKNIDDKASIRDALAATDLKTMAGPVSWKGGPMNPVKNVCRMPLVSGQWVKGAHPKYKYDLLVVNNETAPEIPLQAKPKAIPY
jgi:branched-chain amino acid transport system substrate-binding protein